jgi:hypothetical protein
LEKFSIFKACIKFAVKPDFSVVFKTYNFSQGFQKLFQQNLIQSIVIMRINSTENISTVKNKNKNVR